MVRAVALAGVTVAVSERAVPTVTCVEVGETTRPVTGTSPSTTVTTALARTLTPAPSEPVTSKVPACA
ncbi:hypothetical protein D3C74_443000 [compost metagenome]